MSSVTIGLLTNLLAAGLLNRVEAGHQKLHVIFRESEFYAEIDANETEFHKGLGTRLKIGTQSERPNKVWKPAIIRAGHHSGRASMRLGGLVPDPEEWPTVMDAFELLDEGESYRSINEATGLSLATISRLADRGPDYYHELVESAVPAQ